MPLGPGVRLGAYEIVSAIGAGGMGEVYRARDTKLGRDVALKVLPQALAADPDRVARMHREAQLLAALNDPHIAAIYGFDESGEAPALVLEFVDGETLADRLARGRLPVDEALPIATQIADALEAAHEQGIIHRDLKPANIKVRPDGAVKVLDFGLAKLHELNVPSSPDVANEQSMSPTVHATMAGVILGTAPYMSPEQARGRVVDKRTDIWAFGCVLFEMLTGRRAFPGEDITETLAAVVKSEPDWEALPADTPERVRQMLHRCLEKDPRRRIRDISAAQLLLDGAFDRPAVSTTPTSMPGPPARARVLRLAAVAVSALVVGIALGVGITRGLTSTRPASVAQFVIPKPPEEGLLTFTPGAPLLAISPDGERVVYRAVGAVGQALYLRDRGQLDFTRIRDTDNARAPFFSRDGEWVGFATVAVANVKAQLKRVSVHGGSAQTICAIDGDLHGAVWLEDDTIVFASSESGGLRRVPASGGTPQPVTTSDAGSGEIGHFWPGALPGARQVLFTVWKGTIERSQIAVASLEDGTVSTLASGATFPRFMSGHLVFAAGSELRAVPFTPGSDSVSGAPVSVVQGVSTAGTGAAHYEVSERSLVYLAGLGSDGRLSLASFDRNGAFEPLEPPTAAFELPRVSPDGRRLAYGTADEKEATIWVYELSGPSAARRLTLDGQGRNRYPAWSADGQYVAFQSNREQDLGIFRQRADGSGNAERLTTAEAGAAHIPESWSPDGVRLLYSVVSKSGQSVLWVLNAATREAEPFGGVTSSSSTLPGAVFSPDGKWVAYASSDQRESSAVYVQPFPATGARYQLSRNQDDAHHPVWAPDGKALYFTPGPGGRMNEVKVSTQPTFTFGEATTFPGPFDNVPPNQERPYDISRDGQRFIGLANATDSPQAGKGVTPQIRVVLNWVEDLKRLVPAR